MSTQSIITLDNLPTETAMAQYLKGMSTDVLMNLRFEIGCIDHDKIDEALRLYRLVCGGFCYIDEDQDRAIREKVIREAITKIYEI